MLVVYISNCFAHLFVFVSCIIYVLYVSILVGKAIKALSLMNQYVMNGSNTVFPEAVCTATSLPELSPAAPQTAGRDEAIRFF